MKKILFTLTLSLLTIISFAQAPTFTLSEEKPTFPNQFVAIEVDGLTIPDGYNRALEWINITYNTPSEVIKSQLENKYIRIEGIVQNFYPYDVLNTMFASLRYTIEFKFKTAQNPPFNSSTNSVFLTEFNLKPIANDTGIKGENHTFQITDKPSSKIKDVKKVFNGDNPSDIYIGTIYKSDESTPTIQWRRLGYGRQVPILRIMGEERMKMYGKPLRVFSGDVYGYIDYLSVIAVDGIINTLFMPIEYEYNAKTNITKLKLKQILNNLLPDSTYLGIGYELTFDYGNVVEPTIVG